MRKVNSARARRIGIELGFLLYSVFYLPVWMGIRVHSDSNFRITFDVSLLPTEMNMGLLLYSVFYLLGDGRKGPTLLILS